MATTKGESASSGPQEIEPQQLFWDDEAQRYFKFNSEKDDYYTDDETRAADEAAAQEAAEAAAASTNRLQGPAASASHSPASRHGSVHSVLSAEESPSATPQIGSAPPATGPSQQQQQQRETAAAAGQFSALSHAAETAPTNASVKGQYSHVSTASASSTGEAEIARQTSALELLPSTSKAGRSGSTASPITSAGGRSSSFGMAYPVARQTKTEAGGSIIGDGIAAELEEKRRENELLHKEIEKLTVRLYQAEQGITNDQRLASTIRERDALALQVRRLEEDIAILEAGLEAAAVDKETALAELEKNRELLNDSRLRYENVVIDRELDIANLREELLKQQSIVKEQQQQQLEIQHLKERLLHYEEVFTQLKQLLSDVSTQKHAAEAAREALLSYKEQADKKIQQLNTLLAEDAELLQECEAQQQLQQQVVHAQEQQLERVLQQLEESNTSRLSFQQAFERLTQVFEEKEFQRRNSVEALQRQIKFLQTKIAQLEALTAPRWRRVFFQLQQQQQWRKGSAKIEEDAAAEKSGSENEEEKQGFLLSSPLPLSELELHQHQHEHQQLAERGFQETSEVVENLWGQMETLQLTLETKKLLSAQQQVQLFCKEERLRLLRLALPLEDRVFETNICDGVSNLLTAAYNCFLFLDHLNAVYVQPLAADGIRNPKSMQREQGFIRWLVSCVGTISSLSRSLSLYAFYFHCLHEKAPMELTATATATPASPPVSSSSSSSSTTTRQSAANAAGAASEIAADFLNGSQNWDSEAARSDRSEATKNSSREKVQKVLQQLQSPDGAAYTAAGLALRTTRRLLAAAAACTLSSSISVEPAAEAHAALLALLPPIFAAVATTPAAGVSFSSNKLHPNSISTSFPLKEMHALISPSSIIDHQPATSRSSSTPFTPITTTVPTTSSGRNSPPTTSTSDTTSRNNISSSSFHTDKNTSTSTNSSSRIDNSSSSSSQCSSGGAKNNNSSRVRRSSSTESATASSLYYTGSCNEPGKEESHPRRRASDNSSSSSTTSSCCTGLRTTGDEEDVDGSWTGVEKSIDEEGFLHALLPCVAGSLHAARAAALLGFATAAAACTVTSGHAEGIVQSVDHSSTTESLKKKPKTLPWKQLIVHCTRALDGLPPLFNPTTSSSPTAAPALSSVVSLGSTRGRGFAVQETTTIATRAADEGEGETCRNVLGETETGRFFGEWLLTCMRVELDTHSACTSSSRRSRSREGKAEKEVETASATDRHKSPSCQEAYEATCRLLLVKEAADVLSERKNLAKALHVVQSFAVALHACSRGVYVQRYFLPAPVRPASGKLLLNEAAAAASGMRLSASELLQQSLQQLKQSQALLQEQIKQRDQAIKETEILAEEWKKKYSNVFPKAERYALLEQELQKVLKEKTTHMHMLDLTRRRMHAQQQEQQQLRKEKQELTARLQELTKRLEALRKLSVSMAAAGGDIEQIQTLRQIIRKQEVELLELRVAEVNKRILSPYERNAAEVLQQQKILGTQDKQSQLQELLEGSSGGGAEPSKLQIEKTAGDAAEASVQHESSTGSSEQEQQLQQPLSGLLLQPFFGVKGTAALAVQQRVNFGKQLLEEYRQLRQEVLLHAFRVPLWRPSLSIEERHSQVRQYRTEHDALLLRMHEFSKKIDVFFSKITEGSSQRIFGEYASLSACKYIKKFTDLSRLLSPSISTSAMFTSITAVTPQVEQQPEVQQSKSPQQLMQTETIMPAMRLVLPGRPAWLPPRTGNEIEAAATGQLFAEKSSGRKDRFVQKLFVTEEQLAVLYKKIAGV